VDKDGKDFLDMKRIMQKTLAQKNCKRGFTLVEVIVVLVILAILAAIAIPALTGYIDKARDKALIAEARNVRTALQAIASEQYGEGYTITVANNDSVTPYPGAPIVTTTVAGYPYPGPHAEWWAEAVNRLTGSNYGLDNESGDGVLINIDVTNNKVTRMTVYKPSTKTVTYDAATNKYTISEIPN
jgi:prepilin-type N-terminal cleavage/methylation domain-containing protein